MDFGMVCTVAQTLLTALENKTLRELWSVLGYKSELEALQRTIYTVKAVLHDAEAKQEDLSSEAHRYVNELKDAVYDADDLLDEFASLAERKQLMDGGKFSKKVRVFFSRYNQFGVACSISRGVKHIRNKLDAISSNHSKFGLSLDSRPIKRRREETCSYVYANDIIGREDDVKKVLGMLLDSSVERDVSFLTIVGMGGLGKTALAQLVYNDERVTKEFPLRLWACDGDQDPDKLDLEVVLRKILASATGHKHSDSTMDVVQRKLRDKLVKEKFLLVIDDVWNENREEWLKLERFLKGGQRGSWVLVSTRSHETAKIVNGMMHELKGLSDHSSWCLFKMTAFQETDEQENSSFEDLVEMGQEIVKRCANVPLAIRAMGSLLFGQDISKWQRVLKTGSADIRGNKTGIMPILKLSYDNFELPIKSCFSYCALFSKDFVIDKRMLIELWIAQGYVVPLENGQSIEDAAEDYFMILLRRCFFQDVNKDKEGKIESCKIHDLMHDVALEVSGNEIYQLNSSTISNVHKSVRHLSVSGNEYIQNLSEKTSIRTYLHIGEERGVDKLLVEKMIMNFKRLRTLDLRYSNLESLPDSIGKLLHLRYLNLSWSNILVLLPKSITKLHNLKTLGIEGCYSLNYLPLGMGKLTRLWRLERFMIGQPSSSEKEFFDGLADLGALNNLNGHLELLIRVPAKSVKEDGSSRKGGNEGYLSGKEQLEAIEIVIEQLESCDRIEFEEPLLEMLKPHPNLKNLGLAGYNGLSMPRWATGVSLMETLPNLVDLVFSDCKGLQYLPWLGTLRRLKRLVIRKLPNLEYVEPEASDSSGGGSYFPRLEELQLLDLPKLKGWWPRLLPSLCFSHLKNLVIERCVEMTSFPLCSSVEHLKIVRCPNLVNEERDHGGISWQHFSDSLRTLELLDLTHLENLPKGMEYCTSLHSLSIQKCPKLQSLPIWMPKLTSLSKLQLRKCSKQLKERCQNPTGEYWHLIQQISRILISE